MLWAMCSQWDQGPCWTLKAGAICSVLCHSHLQSSSFLGIGTSVKDFSLVQWTKGPDKAILEETAQRITLQTLLLLLKHMAHTFFLGLWTILIIFSFFLLYCGYVMTPCFILFFMAQSKYIEVYFSDVLTPCLLCVDIKSVEYNSMG